MNSTRKCVTDKVCCNKSEKDKLPFPRRIKICFLEFFHTHFWVDSKHQTKENGEKWDSADKKNPIEMFAMP